MYQVYIYMNIYIFVYYIIDRGFREICRKLSVNSHKALVLRSTTHLGEDWGDLDCYVSYSTLPDMLVFQADKILNKQETSANWQRPKRAYSNYGSVRQTYRKAQTAAFCCTAAQEFCCQGTCLGWRQMSDRRPGCSEFCHFGPLSMMAHFGKWHSLLDCKATMPVKYAKWAGLSSEGNTAECTNVAKAPVRWDIDLQLVLPTSFNFDYLFVPNSVS